MADEREQRPRKTIKEWVVGKKILIVMAYNHENNFSDM
jgi:hypothetical protein